MQRASDHPACSHHFAEVNGVRLHYVEAGAGPLVVLLHGFPEFWYSWRHQIAALATAGYRVIAPDLRGYNESDKPPGIASYRLETELTPEKIQESFASPQTLSFWDLPTFIDALEATGFSSVPQRLHYNALLAQPLLLSAMVLFAAAFALRQTRRGGTLVMAVSGVAAGFFIFVMTDVVMALGLSESIPVGMAAWMPAGVSLLIGTATLLHLEDG